MSEQTNRYLRPGVTPAQFAAIEGAIARADLAGLFAAATEAGIVLSLDNGTYSACYVELPDGVGPVVAYVRVLVWGHDGTAYDDGDEFGATPGTTDPTEQARQALAAACAFVGRRWEDPEEGDA